MKIIAILFIGVFVASQQVNAQETLVEKNEALFDTAWEYQNRLDQLQNDVSQKLFDIRIAATSVLRGSTNATLTQIEANAVSILQLDEIVRANLNRGMPDSCISDLIQILDGVTHMSGAESSNCLKRYDTSVQSELSQSNEILRSYDRFSKDIQQMVVTSFIGKNAFKVPNEIIEKIVNEFKKMNDDWNATTPTIDAIVSNLERNIRGYNSQLGQCFDNLQIEYSAAYTKVNEKKSVCEEFTRSGRFAFAAASSPITFNLEDFLTVKSK